jgi:hypothetical protein
MRKIIVAVMASVACTACVSMGTNYDTGGGEGGIRTLVTVSRKHAFQACAIDHSATSPAAAGGQSAEARNILIATAGAMGSLTQPIAPG